MYKPKKPRPNPSELGVASLGTRVIRSLPKIQLGWAGMLRSEEPTERADQQLKKTTSKLNRQPDGTRTKEANSNPTNEQQASAKQCLTTNGQGLLVYEL
jgi:hypothetical protein